MAEAHLHGERQPHGLPRTARDHAANLRRPPWWLPCPLARRDGGPPRRVAKLYLPPVGRYFGSREAYELTSTSCQESGKYYGLYRRLVDGRDVHVVGYGRTEIVRMVNAVRQHHRIARHFVVRELRQ